ncbi:MAG: hypothetical protein ACRYG7_52225 [Janthinobacterium lividum]
MLLGNLGAFTPIATDTLLVRPGSAALIVLMPQAGHLAMLALTYGTKQLDSSRAASRGRAGRIAN